jgi:hypothetical protein
MVIELVVTATFIALSSPSAPPGPGEALALSLLTASGAARDLPDAWCTCSACVSRSGLFPAVPAIVFCTVFGRAWTEVFGGFASPGARSGLGDVEAIAEGWGGGRTVITSAASIMLVVFATSAAGEFLIIKVLGFTLAVAVFLDATLVRIAIRPRCFVWRVAGTASRERN